MRLLKNQSNGVASIKAKLGWRALTRWILLIQVIGFLVTGVALNYLSAETLELGDARLMQLRYFTNTTHGVLAWAFCFLAGHTLFQHVGLAWRISGRKWGWYVGLGTVSILVLLSLTGLFLLYASSGLRSLSVPLHWWLGLIWCVLLFVHTVRR